MFDTKISSVELPAGEADTTSVWCDDDFDDFVYLITADEVSTGWVADERDVLPNLEAIPPGPFLAVLLESIDRSGLNGFDLVRLLRARERQVSHGQAGGMSDTVEVSLCGSRRRRVGAGATGGGVSIRLR